MTALAAEAEARAAAARLLFVDDEERILSALRRTLRREGYELRFATSPVEAERILEAGPVDLVISDQRMPGQSGIEFLARAARMCPSAGRLLLTGWTEEIPRADLARVGVLALVPKPWDDAELKRALREALAQRRSAG
jgi:response regulator RpfG family c-di-GMP phosphodiesterase